MRSSGYRMNEDFCPGGAAPSLAVYSHIKYVFDNNCAAHAGAGDIFGIILPRAAQQLLARG